MIAFWLATIDMRTSSIGKVCISNADCPDDSYCDGERQQCVQGRIPGQKIATPVYTKIIKNAHQYNILYIKDIPPNNTCINRENLGIDLLKITAKNERLKINSNTLKQSSTKGILTNSEIIFTTDSHNMECPEIKSVLDNASQKLEIGKIREKILNFNCNGYAVFDFLNDGKKINIENHIINIYEWSYLCGAPDESYRKRDTYEVYVCKDSGSVPQVGVRA